MKEEYRIANNIHSSVTTFIKPGLVGFCLMQKLREMVWRPVGPSKEEIIENDMYSPFKYVDPNELNKKLGYPPQYAVIDPREENYLKKWIEQNFDDVEYKRTTNNDILFLGKFKGYEDEGNTEERHNTEQQDGIGSEGKQD